MNKTDLIDKIALETGLSKADAGRALEAFTSAVVSTVKDGSDVVLVGFGTFTKSERGARTGRNPQTGVAIKIPASTVPKFKPGKAFKEAVNR